ncbi:hypothetical protein AWH63_10990 [Marinobacter sp. C18]|uniref:hypothetical protein n=1 Tax=Marinobacter sp. C18 TaxID=1772288 RepID=UPI000948E35B|nr:hypothetical protein [Marinobacter sp. C18]OLF82057.1 hypothetical protein AWH63_10990 [Marinobacter sp. C18]
MKQNALAAGRNALKTSGYLLLTMAALVALYFGLKQIDNPPPSIQTLSDFALVLAFIMPLASIPIIGFSLYRGATRHHREEQRKLDAEHTRNTPADRPRFQPQKADPQ